jgi:uncharacterized caspase-like protein
LRIRSALFAILVVALSNAPALAERRVALVIGNSAYQNVTPLTNPANDATAMTTTLKAAGFDVVDSRRDLKANDMRRALRDFVDKARDADVAVVYYAGHGIEIDGTNYLIPIDANLERDVDAYDEAISLDRILTVMEPAKQLRLAILDACRDNPFNKKMQRTIGSRAVSRGLAKVEPTSPNTLIAFAAKAGSTASDGDSKNSPFTSSLVKYIAKPGLDLRKAFGFVRDDVLKVTNNKQEPFVYGSLGGGDVSLVPAAPFIAPAASDNEAFVQRAYELALQVGTKVVWDSFIAKYPSGLYTELAKAQRDKLISEAARVAATEKAKAAQEEQTRLAIEGAKKAEQDKAAAEALKTEQQRVAAELAKKAEEAKVAEAEKAKAAALAKAAEDARIAALKKAAEDAKIAADKKAAEDAKIAEAARLAAEKKAAEQKAKDDKPIGPVAALAPPDQADQAAPKANAPVAVADLPKQLQIELKRVGCNTGTADGNWNATAQKSLDLFNKNAKTKFDVKLASADALDAVKGKTARVCPLICEHGYKVDGEKCSKIFCRAGFEVGDDNTCEKIEVKKPAPPVAKRDEPAASPKAAESGGQIFCDGGGCRPLRKGCRMEHGSSNTGGSIMSVLSREVCN